MIERFAIALLDTLDGDYCQACGHDGHDDMPHRKDCVAQAMRADVARRDVATPGWRA